MSVYELEGDINIQTTAMPMAGMDLFTTSLGIYL